jgi:uncharacterized protein
MDFQRNNLDGARSPYLRQHAENPVWWQEWNAGTLDHAARTEKPLFVSVGYATCHWCHVMAAEAFSSEAVAQYLNEHFVSIKIDREERPDIDHYLMQFLLATRGNGGWPLNVFLAGPRRPVAALTYVPVEPRGGMPGFVDIAERVTAFIEEKRGQLKDFELPPGGSSADSDSSFGSGSPTGSSSKSSESGASSAGAAAEARTRAANLVRRADREYGGFGRAAKFPPHSTLLFLLHLSMPDDPSKPDNPLKPGGTTVDAVITETLRAIALGGLHDHLQGGFFRYCVDRTWTIPHFEKMLYDQAMLLWVYALGWHRYGDPLYKYAAEGIVTALEETFFEGDLCVSAHDADTDHEEGATYLWTDEELAALTYDGGTDLFHLTPGGNFEGKHHLVRIGDLGTTGGVPTPEQRKTMRHMLDLRRRRPQPETDRKKVTAWNALTGIALVIAGRYLDRPEWIRTARKLRNALLGTNGEITFSPRNSDAPPRLSITLVRSSLDGQKSSGEFLEDYAAFLLLETYLMEMDGPDAMLPDAVAVPAPPSTDTLAALEGQVLRFYHRDDGRDRSESGATRESQAPPGWSLSITEDFSSVPADEFDAPTPSAISLAEYALLRSAQLRNTPLSAIPGAPQIEGGTLPAGPEQIRDFHNLAALFSAGEHYVLHRAEAASWQQVPPGTMQIPSSGPQDDWCYRGACHPGDPPFLG